MTRQPAEMPAPRIDEANAARIAADIARLRRNLQDKQLLATRQFATRCVSLMPSSSPTSIPPAARSAPLPAPVPRELALASS